MLDLKNKTLSANTLKKVVILTLLFSIILSYPLWFLDTSYPKVPFFHFLESTPHIFLLVSIGLVVLASIILLCKKYNKKNVLWMLFVCLFVGLIFFDVNRLQAWVYINLLLILWMLFEDFEKSHLKFILPMFLSSVYIYSGLWKINSSFFESTLPFLVNSFFVHLSLGFQAFLLGILFFIPFFEIGLGVLLFFKQTRNNASNLGIIFHVLIILCILVSGQNYVIIPWNLAMMCFLFFCKTTQERGKNKVSITLHSKILLVVVYTLPIFYLWNLVPPYLAFSFYSGRRIDATLIFKNSSLLLNNTVVKQTAFCATELCTIDLFDWAKEELYVPPIDIKWQYKKVFKILCQKEENEIISLEINFKDNSNFYYCK